MSEDTGHEIKTVRVAGREVYAAQLVCPVCHVLDLHLTVNPYMTPWKATCSAGHEWNVVVE